MKKAGFRSVLALVLLVATAVAVWSVPQRLSSAPGEVEIVVGRGDTLWGLAREYGRPGGDPRVWIHRVRQRNSLESALLYPGQVLKVPNWKETR